jgi:copper chaperone NosL
MKKIQNLYYLSAIMFFIGCSSEPRPEPIHVGEDLCAACRMAIIEPQFASEIIRSSGEVLKYDDLACLAKGAKSPESANPRQIFVQDYVTREWINQEQAVVVRGSTLQSPMGSGTVAFANQGAAEKFIAEHGGELMRLQNFLRQ